MKNSRYKQFINFKLCATLSSKMKPHAVLLHLARDVNHPFVQYIHAVYALCPLVAQQPSRLSDSLLQCNSACVHPYFTVMAPEPESSDAGNQNMPKKNCKMLPLSKKICMYGGEESIYRVWCQLQFQQILGVLEHIPCR